LDEEIFVIHPDQTLNCLLIHTKFSEFSYWNYRISCEALGAKTPSAPLGLITVAAILPQHWQFRLLDLNAREFSEVDWDWADIVCIGGMLPQQTAMLSYINKAKKEQKFVVCGGADPSSQPDLYHEADVIIIGEGENTIPLWLESWRNGEPRGRFSAKEKPDVSLSPVPRFDLLNFRDYLQVGVQYSRGCPFNCEFCDIIELFGRVPRTKSETQFLNELDVLYKLGYRGSLEFVDDNFIGNKRLVKRKLMPALIDWQRRHKYPYFFHTEASMNLADDKKLLRQLRAADFRFIFMGIESPDPEILLQTQKSQNTMGDISKRIQTLYDYGIVVFGGFILGFDGEKKGVDRSMIRLIEEANVAIAMVGLLVALPNTQLTRRLQREGRLVNLKGESIPSAQLANGGDTRGAVIEVVDQTTAGLNFITKRSREEIFDEYSRVVSHIYDPKVFADRVLRTAKAIKFRPRHLPSFVELLRQLRGFCRVSLWFSKRRSSRYQYWRVVFKAALMGPFKFEVAMKLMGLYLHLEDQTSYVLNNVEKLKVFGREFDKRQQTRDIEEQMKIATVTAKVIPDFLPLEAIGKAPSASALQFDTSSANL
jgi:radical SAM superfamily enzyme YgiQ (UPF0313 family)